MKLNHVRISDKGKELLSNPALANAAVDTILKHGREIQEGIIIKVESPSGSVEIASAIPFIKNRV